MERPLHGDRKHTRLWRFRACASYISRSFGELRELELYVFGRSSVWACRKLEHLDILRHHKCYKCQTLHDGITH